MRSTFFKLNCSLKNILFNLKKLIEKNLLSLKKSDHKGEKAYNILSFFSIVPFVYFSFMFQLFFIGFYGLVLTNEPTLYENGQL